MNQLIESLIALSGQKNTVVIRKPFVQFTGSLEAGLLLGQLLYWTPRASVPGQWIAKTDADFSDELCLSSYMVRKARKALKGRKILQTTIRKFAGSPTVHYRLNLGELQEQWKVWLSQMDIAKSQERSCENARTLTETTAENTTEVETKDVSTATATPAVSPPPPKKEPPRLAPDTSQSQKAFDKLRANAALKGRRGPQQFKTQECKQKFDAAAAELLNGEFDKALKAALEQGITSVTGVTNYIAKWASNLKPRHLKIKA